MLDFELTLINVEKVNTFIARETKISNSIFISRHNFLIFN